MSTEVMTMLSVIEVALLVLVLSVALALVHKGLAATEDGLGQLAGALATVQSQHLRGLGGWVSQINGCFVTILSVLPGIAAKAAFVVRKVTGG